MRLSKSPRRVSLPTYPFERRRYWIGLPEQGRTEAASAPTRDISDWFYVPSWKPALPAPATNGLTPSGASRWLLFSNDDGVSREIVARLKKDGKDVAAVVAGAHYEKREDGSYQVRPGERADYDTLIKSWPATPPKQG